MSPRPKSGCDETRTALPKVLNLFSFRNSLVVAPILDDWILFHFRMNSTFSTLKALSSFMSGEKKTNFMASGTRNYSEPGSLFISLAEPALRSRVSADRGKYHHQCKIRRLTNYSAWAGLEAGIMDLTILCWNLGCSTFKLRQSPNLDFPIRTKKSYCRSQTINRNPAKRELRNIP